MKRFYFRIIFTIILISSATTLMAQETIDSDPELPGIQQPTAPVKVDGMTLFNVRGISSFTAEKRANAISSRIRDAAHDRSQTLDSLQIKREADHTSVYLGKWFIMSVYNADAELHQVERESLVNVVLMKVAEGVSFYRSERSRPSLIKKSIIAVALLLALVFIILVINRTFKRIDRKIHAGMKTQLDKLEAKSFSLIQSSNLLRAYDAALKILRIVLVILLSAVTINYILGLFPWTNNLATTILKAVLSPVVSFGKSLAAFFPKLMFLVVIFLVARYILKLARLLSDGLQQEAFQIKGFDPDWATPTYKIFRILVIAFSVVVAYPYIPGSESNAFKGVSVFFGVLLSLGSSSFISNLIAGYSMTYRRAFKKGDRIEVDGQTGFVEEQEILVTRLKSVKNEEIIIPNSVLLNSNITNYSSKARERNLIVHTTVGIGYETPWRMVDAMLKLAADRTEGLLKDPPPFVLKLSLGDFAVTYEINAYCNDALRLPHYYSALHQNILDVFNENNVQIMTPAYEGDPEIPKVVPKDQWHTPLSSETEA